MSKMHHWSKAEATAQNQIKKRKKNNVNDYEGDEMSDKVDRISALPNDILIYLLSLVEMKTAGRTSLLSRRWRYVWTHLTDLIFEEDEESLLQLEKIHGEKERFKERFLKWVNQVMIAHHAPYLNSLRIHFPLHGSCGDQNIEKWVKFGLKKNVVNLVLNLATFYGYNGGDREVMEYVRPTFRHQYYGSTTLKNYTLLKSLHLEAISVEGPALENVLSNCVNVESLTMRFCHFLPNIITSFFSRPIYSKLVISSHKLKHLEFSRCGFKSIHISAPQLTSFTLLVDPKEEEDEHTLFPSHLHKEVVYEHVPSLVDVTFRVGYCYHISHNLNVFSKFSYRLQKLSIYWDKESHTMFGFPNLYKFNLLLLTSVIEACPLLHAFKLEVDNFRTQQGVAMAGDDAENNNHVMRAHERLKVVELVGFDASASMVELAIFLTQHSPVLRKIILDPRSSRLIGGFFHILIDKQNVEGLDFSRKQAKLLAKQIRGGVEVVIL